MYITFIDKYLGEANVHSRVNKTFEATCAKAVELLAFESTCNISRCRRNMELTDIMLSNEMSLPHD